MCRDFFVFFLSCRNGRVAVSRDQTLVEELGDKQLKARDVL